MEAMYVTVNQSKLHVLETTSDEKPYELHFEFESCVW